MDFFTAPHLPEPWVDNLDRDFDLLSIPGVENEADSEIGFEEVIH